VLESTAHAGAMSSPILRRFATGAFWSISGSVCSRALAMVAAMLVARHLKPTAFGEYNLVLTSAGLFQAFASFGLYTTVTKQLSGDCRSHPQAAGRVVALSWIVAAAAGVLWTSIMALAGPWIARELLGAPQLSSALRIGSLLLFFVSMTGAFLGVLTGLERFRLIGLVSAASGAASIPLIVLGSVHGGVLGAVVGTVAAAAVTVALHAAAVRVAIRSAGIRPQYAGALRERGMLLSYGLPAMLSELPLAPVAWITSVIVASQASGMLELGLFSAANQWRNAIVLVATATGFVLFPLFSDLHANGRARAFARTFWTGFSVIGAVGLAAAAVLAAVAPMLMRSAYGSEFGGATSVLVVLVVSGAIAGPLSVATNAIVGAGRIWLFFGLQCVWACTLVGITYALRSRGALGLSTAHVVASLVHLLMSVGCTHLLVRRLVRGEHLHAF
jgi:O-antigen/teichoic acid export membrane protein